MFVNTILNKSFKWPYVINKLYSFHDCAKQGLQTDKIIRYFAGKCNYTSEGYIMHSWGSARTFGRVNNVKHSWSKHIRTSLTMPIYTRILKILNTDVGNELVHAGSHAHPLAVDRGMPSQGGSTEWWYLYLIKFREPTVREIPPRSLIIFVMSTATS